MQTIDKKSLCICGNQKGHATKHVCLHCGEEWGSTYFKNKKLG